MAGDGTEPGPPQAPGKGPTRRMLSAVLWPPAVMTYLHTVSVALGTPRPLDFETLYKGAVNFLDHDPVYEITNYLFFPAGLLLSAPIGLASFAVSHALVVVLGALCAPIAGAVVLRCMDVDWRSPVGAATLLGLALSAQVTLTLTLGNVNTVLALLAALFLLFLLRGRHVASGLMLGLAIALKPIAGPGLLVALLARRWCTALVAVAVAGILNLWGLLLVADPHQFFTTAMTRLGATARTGGNWSIHAAAAFLHLPAAVEVMAQVLVVIVVVLTLVWSRRVDDEPTRVATQLGVLLLGLFLVPSLTELYWSILLLPLILTVVRPSSPMHSWPAWVGLYLMSTLDYPLLPLWPPALSLASFQLSATIGWSLLLVVCAVWARRQYRERSLPCTTGSAD